MDIANFSKDSLTQYEELLYNNTILLGCGLYKETADGLHTYTDTFDVLTVWRTKQVLNLKCLYAG